MKEVVLIQAGSSGIWILDNYTFDDVEKVLHNNEEIKEGIDYIKIDDHTIDIIKTTDMSFATVILKDE